MRLRTGNMLDVYGNCDLFLFTANATITKDSRLVMGAGIAKTLKSRLPSIDAVMARAITDQLRVRGVEPDWSALREGTTRYLLVVRSLLGQDVGAFQVKYHWSQDANLPLIQWSCDMLADYIGIRGPMDVHLNFPGIGNGRLPRDKVLPIISSSLPDCVTVWELP